MQVRDRIQELRRVRAAELRPNPRNWRTHPAPQRDALRGLLSEIGYAGALLARELPDGSLELIDGHLRAETTPDSAVPVLVLDVTAAEADKLLATFDPLSALAGADAELLANLVADVETNNAAVQSLLDELAAKNAPVDSSEPDDDNRLSLDDDAAALDLFQIIVECNGEAQQRAVFEQLQAQGLRCRLMVL